MTEITAADVRRGAMDLLARREHSRRELHQKLHKRFGSDAETLIEEEIEKLTAEGLQSDARLAEAFIRARTNRGQGPVKIRAELKGKGVPEDAISLAFEECAVDWFELVQDVATRKFGSDLLHSEDLKEKARIGRFLQQRGFSFDHISSLA